MAKLVQPGHRAIPPRSVRARLAIGIVLAVVIANGVEAAAATTTLDGQFGSQENGCMHVSAFYYRVDCGYSSERKRLNATGALWPWVGPTSNPVYYAPDGLESKPAYTPVVGDSRRAPWTTARVTIDTAGTPSPTDDRIAVELLVGPGARNLATRVEPGTGRPIRVVESWSELRHTLAPTAVTTATPNQAGGFDYVIGAKGFPQRLCRHDAPADCFPSANAALLRAGAQAEKTWGAASPVGIARGAHIGGNGGATTSAAFSGYRCADSAGGTECRSSPMAWGARPKPGFDNLLLRVSTDGKGRVATTEGYWTHEFNLPGGPPRLAVPVGDANSWLGGYFELARRTTFGSARR